VIWGFIGSRHARFSDFVRSPGETLRYIGTLASGHARRYIGHNPAGAAMVLALLLSLAGTTVAGFMLYAIEEDAGPLASWVADTAASGIRLPTIVGIARADDDDEHRGGKGASSDHEAREEFWEEIHEFFANFTLLLVGIHVLGVLYSSYLHNENLPRAMFTGRKRSE
jgi:cytochrome b